VEDINNLDEAKLLGYFESIKSVFLLKLIFLVSFLKEEDGKRSIDASRLTADAVNSVRLLFDDPLFYKALGKGNEELYLNYLEDMLTSLMTSSWNVFEQITKDLAKTDYATQVEEQSVAYQNKRFQLDAREKKDVELFYYFRNAIHHYNGAYYAVKEIDHRYAGKDFKSKGHHGEKIEMDIKLAWNIACDLERYTIKAWNNAKNFNSAKP
jgi:hypothetical protein